LQEARARRDDALEGFDDDAAELMMMPFDNGARGLQIVEGRDEHLIFQYAWNSR
jgi:hypothetical protein